MRRVVKTGVSIIIAAVMCLSLLTMTATAAEEFEVDSSNTLIKYNGPGGAVVIPNGITGIGQWAFYEQGGNSSILSVTIPDSVTSIGSEAFLLCVGLNYIFIPSSVTSISEDAFIGCWIWLTIYGESSSYAETYANENRRLFEVADSIPGGTPKIVADGTPGGATGGAINDASVSIMAPTMSFSARMYGIAVVHDNGSVWVYGTGFFHGADMIGNFDDAVAVATCVGDSGIFDHYILRNDNTLWHSALRDEPEKIMDNIVNISAGYSFMAAIDVNNDLWIRNNKIMSDVADVTSDAKFALKTDGSVWEIESNKKIMDDVRSIDSYSGALYALKSDGNMMILGRSDTNYGNAGTPHYYDYELYDLVTGVASNVYYDFPNPYCISDSVVMLSVGTIGLLAKKADGTMWHWDWGESTGKQIDIGDDIYYFTCPSIVRSSNEPVYALFIKSDGSLWLLNDYYGSGMIASNVRLPEFLSPGIVELPYNLSAASEWARDTITDAIESGFVPNNLQNDYTKNITRAEFCNLAVELYENVTGKEMAGRTKFDDTDDINVEKIAAINVVNGVGNNRFDPDNYLTREQAAIILARLADAAGVPFQSSEATFSDNSSISSWAIESVGQVQAAGIMGGAGDNMFSPSGAYTREQSIVTIMRMYESWKQ